MKLSRGRMSRGLMGIGVAAATFIMSSAAIAAEVMGQPQEWEYKLQKAATPIMMRLKTICSVTIQAGYSPGMAAITSVMTGKIWANRRSRWYAQRQPRAARHAK